jgi:hypothetical protein
MIDIRTVGDLRRHLAGVPDEQLLRVLCTEPLCPGHSAALVEPHPSSAVPLYILLEPSWDCVPTELDRIPTEDRFWSRGG